MNRDAIRRILERATGRRQSFWRLPSEPANGGFSSRSARLARNPSRSPDGRFIAYLSNETGGFEIFVRPFPDVSAGKWQVSTEGGQMPLWAHNGRELFFVDDGRGIVAVQVDTSGGFRQLSRDALFTIPERYITQQIDAGWWDVTHDDQRFLMPGVADQSTERALDFVLVNNFFEELKARVGG